MDQLKPPNPLNFDENISNSWKTWKKHFDFYLVATEADAKADKVKTSILLTCIGEKGRQVYDTFDFHSKENALELALVIKKFDEYCTPRKNTTILRHKFFTSKQQEGQLFNDFLTELKRLSDECEFDTLKDSLIKDMIVCGVWDTSLRERLLRDANLDLNKAIKTAYANEQTKLQIKNFEQETVHEIRRKDRNNSQQQNIVNNCRYCTQTHARGNCPAFGKRCQKCNKRNHFAKCCLSKTRDVNTVENDVVKSSDEFVIDSIKINSLDRSEESNDNEICFKNDSFKLFQIHEEWNECLEINNISVKFKLDSGAQVNVIPRSIYKKLQPRPKLRETKLRLTAYNNTTIPIYGKCIATLKHQGTNFNTLFTVVDDNYSPILGLKTSEHLNLIKRIYNIDADKIFSEFKDCFGEMGCLSRIYHID